MELIIDSSNIEQIKELNELLTITGVTTNPTILTKSNREAMDVVKDLCEVLSEDQCLFKRYRLLLKVLWKRQK
mgnify:CR=1 FL=1